MPGRQLDDQAAVKVRQTAPRQDQAAIRRARQSRYGAFDFTGIAHVDRIDLDPVRGRSSLDDAELGGPGQIGGIAKDPHSRYVWRDLLKQLQPFAAQTIFKRHKSGGIAAGPSQAFDEAGTDRIDDDREHDRYRTGRLQQRSHSGGAMGQDDVWCK